jgi:hypothetical protein
MLLFDKDKMEAQASGNKNILYQSAMSNFFENDAFMSRCCD